MAVGALVCLAFLTEFDINFYLAERPPALWLALGLLAAIAVGMLCFIVPTLVSWLLALPLVLFERTPSRAVLRVSASSYFSRLRERWFLPGSWRTSCSLS